MSNHTLAQVLLAEYLDRSGRKITPNQASIWTCLITALINSLPKMIADFFACIGSNSGNGGDGSSGYNPGNRPRCA